ncbi:FN1 [Branchiostoma lanceolatum]|uniref:FN1 protein n=1 Tax=Branchiostoma lanceolatum TaxID=7740 RepID=A0A8K0F1X9_BRALA|nr:FN1 [Branchiostoma lanceolatum]CAH1274587.1 FN1 [Branchiostoma lanceolatum]
MLQPILAIPLLTVLMAQGGLATYPHRGAVQGSASDGNTCYSTRGPLSYNPLRQICCADGVYEGAEANYICKICETTMFAIPKSSRPWRCCGRNNDQPYNPETSHCCFGQVKDGPEDTTSCFRCSADSIMSIPRDESKSYMCCGDQPYNTLRQHCCAGSLNNGPESAYICQSCGDNMMSRRRDLPPLRCCGVNNEISYDPSTHHCCGGFNQPKYGPQRDYVCQRCGNSYFSRPATDGSWRCCKGQPYNPAEQHCCFNGLHSGSEEHFTCQRCGNEVFSRRRDEPEYWCCSHPKMSEMTPYNPQSQTCCNGQIFSGPDNQHSCQVCGSTPFVRPSTDEPWRCCNTVTPYSPQRDHCCFGELRSGSEEQSTCVRCGKNLHTVPVNGQPWGCCGAEAFNPEREVCCNGQVYPGLVCGYEALPAPGTVLGLAAENVDSYSVGLRWYSPSNTQGLFGYRIFYRSASGGQESVVDTRSLGTSYTLSGLQPDSQYIIQVMAYGIAGDGQRSNTLRVQTAPEIGGSTPAQFVQARPRDSDSVDLEWNAPAGITTDRVQGYRILYKQTTETNTAYLDVGRPVSGTSFTLGGLEPHTDYDIVIVTIDDTGASSHSMPVRVRTAEGIPGPPGSLQRTAVGSNRLQVAWEPPASVNGVLEGYRLYYQVRGEDSPRVVELGPESTRYTLTGLESSTQYIVWVSAFTSAGEGLRSGNIAIRTSGGIPGAVRSLRGDPISPTSVRVQWEKPTYNADGVQGYRLYYMQVGGRDIPAITLEGNLQSYIISGLQPNSGYEIWLVAFTSAGDGQESPHITVRTGSQETVYPPSQPQQPQLPGTPRDVRVSTVDPFTILVHWQPPTSGGDISNYLVYYQVADENRAISVQSGPNDRSHLLGGLQPDTQYLIWIVAVSPVGVGLRSPAVPVQTQAVDVLPDAPRGLQVTPIGPTMIRVQWVPPRGGGAVSGYRIYYQVLGQPSLSLEADASERTRIIGQLLPNTEYTVWVLAFNPAGEDGSETQRFTVRTTAAVPGFVPRINVTAIDDTTLWVSWEAPETGAPVRGYRIYYQAMSGDQMPSTVETGPLVQSQAVSGLEPGIEYMIWIVAFSNQGDSEDSPRVRIRTNARVPDRAQPLPEIPPVAGVPGIPQDIQGTSLSSSSIQVQWQEPATDAAPSGYRVYYQVVGEATISFKESRAEQRILIVEDLQPNTDYNIWVTAYSPAGTGQRSARITVRTLQETPQLPGVPDDVRVVDVGQTTIHVQWQRPRAGGDVTGYRIYYQPENQVSASAEVVNPSTLSYIIPGLQPDMEYTVWLVALSSLGMGLRSPLVTVRTEPTEGEADYTPEVPGMPEDVTAYATSAVSIRVEWQTPTQEDRVSGYRIRYQAEGDPAISTIEVDREERSYDIMALTPETDYTVWVVAFSAEGMGLRSPKVHARTPEDVPALPGSPASIQARPTDMATVLVEWRQPTTSGRVDGYRIYYQASNNPQVASIDVGPQTLSQSVGGLESGTEYTFWVQAVNAAGLGYRSPVVTAITDAPAPSLPGVPQNVQATALSPMTILVEWEAPSLGGDVQGYMVYHQSREGGTTLREVGPSVNSLILSDLRPETRYSIWVVAHSDAGMGLRSSMKSLQTPAEGPRLPGRPMNVLATAIDAKSILVEWQQPTFGGPLDQYRIYYEKSTDQTTSMVEVGPGTVSYTLMDLLPDTEYSIWVVGLSNVGMGERSPIITVRTLEAPRLPETLSNVRVSPTGPTSITVEWEAPDADDVQGYEIYYQTDNLPATSVEMGPDDRYYTISDLLPGQEYTVWLVALTFTGRRVSSQTFTIRTEQQALPGVPDNVRAFPTGPTSILVQWQLPSTGSDVQGYRIYSQAEHGHVSSVEVGPDTAFYTLTDLMPDTEYTVWVIAFSAAGMGDRSVSLAVRTEEEAPKVPGAPGSVRLTPSDPTSITVEWEAPTTGGDVEGYNVYYQPEDGNTRTAQVEPSDIPSYTIMGLTPNTLYTVWVIAFSSDGLGQRSQMVNVMTEQQAPQTPGVPRNVEASSTGPTTIVVQWASPDTGAEVQGYTIYYQPENEPTMRVQVSPSDIPYTIRDLLPDTQYTIWIVAFSTEGMGERSPALTVSTQEEAPATPGAPGSVRLTPSDPTSITVEWEAPTTGGDVEYYVIYYQAENEPTMRVQVSPSDIPYTIRDLLPDTQYTIWIVAFSTEGMGERSPALTVSTQQEAPKVPAAPGSVRLTPSGPTSITVEWEAPTTGGDVEYYVIYYQAENEPTMRVQVSPSDIPYTIRDLLPDTQYTIWIVAFSTEGMGERSPALTVSTQEEAPATPGAPGSVRLTPSDPTSITVEWEAPTTGGDVEYYVIYYQTEDEPVLTVQLDQTMRQYTIEDLLPDTPYTVWIVAFSAEGEGERSSVYYVQTAAEAEIPGAPGNVQVTPFNATALTVEWEAPTRGGDFQGYRIYYEAPGDSTPGFVDTPSSVTSFLLTGLQPDTTYNVWVLAFSPAGMSQRSLMRTLTTLQVVQGPSAPAFIRASPLDGTSLVVEWEASESENVQGYIIYYQAETETSPSSVEADPSTLQSTIRGLRPDTTYTLWVVSYSPEGTSPSSPTVSAQTLQEAPGLPGSPEGLRVRAVNPKTALLTWQEPSSGADFDGYRVYYQRVEDPESVTTVNVHRSSTSYILENLQPGQKYLMWIAAYSTRGVSEVTQRVDLRMPQGSLPGAPLNVRASSTEPTSIVVQWDSPRSGGDVERYQIYYRSSEDSSVSQIPVRGDELTWTITGLQTDLDYMVWIEAVNSEGSGPRSDVINVQTPSEAPGEPQNLQVESTFLTSVTITWEAPTSGGELEGYRIYYQRVGDDGMRSPTRVIGPDERSFSLTGLEQGTDYRIYLVPFSSDRVGTSSPVLSVRTQSAPVPQPPGTPLSVRASALDSSSVRVTWRHPTRGGAAAGYKVHYQVAGEPEVVTVEVRPTDRALMLSGLRPSTSYDIWMTAFSLAGSSPRTPSVMVRTPEMAPQTPGRPRSIRAETLNPTTMYVQWQHPVRGTDLVERYRVYYQAVRAPTPSFRVARADETSITIPGMASSTTYNIWVVAVSAAGAGQPSPSITLATPDAVSEVPGSPEDIQVSLEDDSSIRVEWQPPTSGGEVLGYRINYQEAGNEDATTIEVGPYVYYQVIRRLKPDTEYYIWVVGFSSDGDGRRSQILSVTMESEGSTQLGPPADLQVSLLDDESVLLQWSAPETAAGILGYRLYYQPIGSTDVSNLEVGPDVSSHPIRGLEPGVDYVVWIVAFTQEGEGLRSAKMNVRIDRQVIGGSTYPGEGDRINIIPGVVVPNPSSGSTPDQEDRWALLGLPASPENVQVARVDSTTMRVQWMPPTSGGRVAGYRIYYQGPDDDESRSIDTPPSARTQTITGLVPGVDYNIWVLAFSLVGVGPQSDSFTVRTYPQGPVPRAPADVQMAVVNPSMVRLNWEPPTALSGPILGYRIFYNPILTNMLNVREVGPTVTEYSLMDLDPYLGYNIWVLAFTEAREGQRSLSIMLPPRAQRGSSVGGSASPREVTFTAMTPNSIKIQWEKPTDSVDVIDGYGILYRSAGEDQTQTIEVGVDESEYILTGLVPDTEYILQLLAFTASGQEYRSPQISVRTSGSSQPDLGRVGVSGSSSISSTAHMSVVPSGGGTGRVIVRGGGDSGPRLPSGGQSFVIRTDANGQRSFILPNGESASGQGVQISPDGQGVVIRTDGSSTSNGQVFLVPANGGSATGGGGQTFVINPNQGEVITSSGGSSSSGGQAFLVPVSGSSGSTRDGQTVVHRFNGRPDDALQSALNFIFQSQARQRQRQRLRRAATRIATKTTERSTEDKPAPLRRGLSV